MTRNRTSAQVVFGKVLEKPQAGEVICPECGHHFQPKDESEPEKPEGGADPKTDAQRAKLRARWASTPGLRMTFGCGAGDDEDSAPWKEGLRRYLRSRRFD